LEIFRVMEKNVPVETLEIKESVKSFHWETNGNRFCILTVDDNGHNLKAAFYALSERECTRVAVHDLHAGISQVVWAPAGQYFCMAAIPGGDMIFGQLDMNNKLDILHKDEHFLLTEVHWDPSGRFLISAVTQSMTSGVRYQTEAGYKMWSFQGRILYQFTKEKMFQISWRPHPPSLLTEVEKTDIRGNLKKYSKRYDSLDDQNKELNKVAQMKERVQAVNAFDKILARLEEYKASKWEVTGWGTAWDALLASSVYDVVTEVVEEVLDVKEEVITD